MGGVAMVEIVKCTQPLTAAATLADRVSTLLVADSTAHGQATLAVSGGKTPLPLFAELRHREIPWSKITITLVDERWVDPAHEDSNERLVRTSLLTQHAAAANFIPMKNQAATARQGEETCARKLAAVPLPHSVLLLGMGNDGHTASIFPGAERLNLALGNNPKLRCLAITPPAAPHERMTLSLAAILNSRHIFLYIQGEQKLKTLQQALLNGPEEHMPIRAVLNNPKTPVTVYWVP